MSEEQKHRSNLKPTCPFPKCVLKAEHAGDHKFRKAKYREWRKSGPSSSKPSKSRITKLPKKHEDFCQFVHASDNATQSAIKAGLSGQWGRIIIHYPQIQKRLEEIREDYVKRKIERRVKKDLVTEEFVDEKLMEIMVHGQKKPYQLKAAELAYRKLKLIEPEHGPRAYAGAFAGSQPGSLGGATMQEVYKAKWLREKEAELAAQNEVEFNQQKQLIEGNPQNA